MKTRVFTETEVHSMLEVVREVMGSEALCLSDQSSLEDVVDILEGGVQQEGFPDDTVS